jgi:hypothetical protein
MFEIEFAGGFKKLLEYIEGVIYKVVKDILMLPQKTKRDLGLKKKDIERLKRVNLFSQKFLMKRRLKF